MIKEKRIKKIHDYVIEQHSASLDELVSVFDVSKNTIRRDVQTLVERGELKKFMAVYLSFIKNWSPFKIEKHVTKSRKLPL